MATDKRFAREAGKALTAVAELSVSRTPEELPDTRSIRAHRRTLRFCLCALVMAPLIAIATGADTVSARPAKPNIVIILADDMGFSDLGSYGGEIHTPNLDRLAANGLRFTQFYNTARCWPSRAALMTGYYAQAVRRDAAPGLALGTRPAWSALLPQLLGPLGYRTYHSGKWHIDETPTTSGFDRSFSGFKNSKEVFGNDGQFSGIVTIDGRDAGYVKPDSGYYSTVAIMDHAIEQLQDHAKNFKEQPFFQFVAFISPHFPLQALPQDIARYKNRYLTGWDAMREQRWQRVQKLGIVHSDFSTMERNIGPPYPLPDDIRKLGPDEINSPVPWNTLNPDQKEFQATKMAIHAAMVDRIDQEVGRLIEQLKRMGVYDNTAILFLSDNGASAEMMVRGLGHDPTAAPGSAHTYLSLGPGWSSASNTPFRRHKVWVHEGGISTPLIVHWPNVIHAKGELRNDPAHLIDIVPTLMEMAGGTLPTVWNGLPVPPPPGKSLVPEFAKDGAMSHDYLWWMHEGNRALRMGNWKIVSAGDRSSWDLHRMTSEPQYFDAMMVEAFKAPWELYDLSKDRAELHDLAAEYPERVQEMAQIWSQVYAKNLELAGGAHPTRAAIRSESESYAKD